MSLSARFGSALAALPAAVRARLDGDSDIDWDSLTDRTTASGIDEIARTPTRLPPAVEALTERLVADVGIAPADVVRGVQGSGIAGTWMHAVAVEPDGECYRLRIKRSGELLPGVRPSALAGYAVLGMELATTVQRTSEAWAQAGERGQAAPGDGLAQCAMQMLHRLRAFPRTLLSPPSTLALARSMEDEWNAQALEVREALAKWQIACPWDACAPRTRYFSVETGYRLHAFDITEARWLQALAEHAVGFVRSGAGTRPVEDGPDLSAPNQIGVSTGITTGPVPPLPSATGNVSRPDEVSNSAGDTVKPDDDGAQGGGAEAPVPPEPETGPGLNDPSLDQVLKSGLSPDEEGPGNSNGALPDPEVLPTPEQRSADGTTPDRSVDAPASDDAADPGASSLFGTTVEVRSPQAEIDLLVQAARRVPSAVTRRLGAAYGDSVIGLLGRLQDSDGVQDLRDALGMEPPGNAVPGWLEELAAKLLLDTGAQTRDGQRIGPVQLDPEPSAGGLTVSDATSSALGVLRTVDVIEQVRLSLSFASDTWSAVTLLSDAGKEAEWTLRDAAVKQARLTGTERTRLEATQRIEHELQRIQRSRVDGSSSPPSALEEAALVAGVLKSLQPSERADAGWPADVGLPNPYDPDDIAQVMTAAENLHREVRAIANRLIAVWVADVRGGEEAQGG